MLAFLRICSGPTLLSATIHLRIIVRLGDDTFNFNIQRMVALIGSHLFYVRYSTSLGIIWSLFESLRGEKTKKKDKNEKNSVHH